MNKVLSGKTPIIILTLILIFSVSWMVNQNTEKIEEADQADKILATIHKSQYCGCCGAWGSYMENEGYEVVSNNHEDMSSVKEEFNIPYELESCHTSEIEGYVIEGHVPNEAIEKLLEERPNIHGIGMSGMPSGSPGMPGPKEDFLIYEIGLDGSKGDLFMKL